MDFGAIILFYEFKVFVLGQVFDLLLILNNDPVIQEYH
jgi:hypothetical protein